MNKAEAVIITAANYEADMHGIVDALLDAICTTLAPVLYDGNVEAACAAIDRTAVHHAVDARADRLRKDMARYTNADNNALQQLRGDLELKIVEVQDISAAVAKRQEELLSELREALRGVSFDTAEEVRAALTNTHPTNGGTAP